MNKKILVVDDDLDLVELLVFNLRRGGFRVATATDGIEALKKARSLRPDLILLDVLLPELDGFAVCEILRRDPGAGPTPVIMVSALASQFARLTGLAAGAVEFVPKPFSPKELVSRVSTILGGEGRPVPS